MCLCWFFFVVVLWGFLARFSFSFQPLFSEVACTSGLCILIPSGFRQEQAGTWEPQMVLHKSRDSELSFKIISVHAAAGAACV